MIRINLLGGERQVKKKVVAFDIGQRLTLACSLILVVGAGGIGYWYWSLQQRSAQVDADIARAQQEQLRLQSIIREVNEFEQERAALQQRVALIEQLRNGQSVPVQLLDIVSKSMPDMLWLTDLKKGERHHPSRTEHHADCAVRFRRESRQHAVSAETDRDRRQQSGNGGADWPGRQERRGRGPDQVHRQGHACQWPEDSATCRWPSGGPRSTSAPPPGGRR
jgi:hypothetical protein